MPYLSDPTLIPRVQKYLESNVDKPYVDINVMADELQRTYREYASRKRNVFRASVNKAYSIVLEKYRMESPVSEGETVESYDSNSTQDPPEDSFNNSMNNQLLNMYRKPLPIGQPRDMDENELIDISSDDSQDTPPPSTKFTNQVQKSVKPTNPMEKTNYEENNFRGRLSDAYLTEMSPPEQERSKKRKLDYATITTVKSTQNKRKKTTSVSHEGSCTFKDIGGLDKVLEEVCKLLLHISHPEIYRTIGITPPRGFLLHGPPGCGKTLLANAIAGELGIPLLKVAAPELVAGVSGGSEERIRDLFDEAVKTSPCVLFIDEIDAITPNRQNVQKDMEKRIVAQLLSCLDDLNKSEIGSRVLVIGATNRPDSIDPALRRAGRFDREISLGIPNKENRAHILKIVTRNLKLSNNFDYELLASYTPGYVGADLVALTREAAMAAVNRLIKEIKEIRIAEEAAAAKRRQLEIQNANNKSVVPVDNQEPEIIVDDDIPKENESVNGTTTENEDVLVIDDDSKGVKNDAAEKPPEKPEEKVPEKAAENVVTEVEEAVEENIDVVNTDECVAITITPLDEMLIWLHDKLPLTEKELQGLCITMPDFEVALKSVQPSAKREGFATVPNTTWDDVGSLKEIREELQMSIVAPVRHSKQFEEMGIDIPTGVLLCGPPGCGKTLLAKAIANEAGINFLSVKGPELLNMYVGESERAVRVCFERARNSSPCVIFFDELDALCPKRSSSGDGSPTMRVVNQLLTEMDGIGSRKGVFILAASNRPDIIDSAILRPGRLDKILFVGLPTSGDRVDILRAITKNGTYPKLSPEVDLEVIANAGECSGFTGADLAALVREAGVLALKDLLQGQSATQTAVVTLDHFKKAFSKIRPSVSEKDREHYDKLRKVYSSLINDREVEEMELS